MEFGQTVLLVGNNAQGKSNFLEAIYFLATTKSPRADKDVQLIKEGEGGCFVKGEITTTDYRLLTTVKAEDGRPKTEDNTTKLEIGMKIQATGNGLEKKVKVNGVPRRSVDYIGNLVVVHFAPEDINLVTGPPTLRRWHIDLCLAQIDKLYKNSLTKYHEALTSRNRILKRIKEGLAKVDELTFWDTQMLDFGTVVADKRKIFFESINHFKNGSQFKYIYHENLLTEERLKEYLGREIAATNSLIGPHRDDFVFEICDNNLAHFGSRGEQRTAVLDLKLAELHFIRQFKDILPVLLLDDVFSELDTSHQEHVIEAISGQQTIISAVENDQIPSAFLKKVQIINVEDGKFII